MILQAFSKLLFWLISFFIMLPLWNKVITYMYIKYDTFVVLLKANSICWLMYAFQSIHRYVAAPWQVSQSFISDRIICVHVKRRPFLVFSVSHSLSLRIFPERSARCVASGVSSWVTRQGQTDPNYSPGHIFRSTRKIQALVRWNMCHLRSAEQYACLI